MKCPGCRSRIRLVQTRRANNKKRTARAQRAKILRLVAKALRAYLPAHPMDAAAFLDGEANKLEHR